MNQPTTTAEWVRTHLDEIRQWPSISTDNAPRCQVDACERLASAVGLCRTHYLRAKRMHQAEIKKGTNR